MNKDLKRLEMYLKKLRSDLLIELQETTNDLRNGDLTYDKEINAFETITIIQVQMLDMIFDEIDRIKETQAQ